MKKEILVTSFGTSFPETREKTIGAIEATIAKMAGEGYIVRRAFTSGMIIKKIRETEGVNIDNIDEGISRAIDEGIQELIIQPTHFMKGREYDKIVEAAAGYRDRFQRLYIGAPLMYSSNGEDEDHYDFEPIVDGILSEMDHLTGEDRGLVFMGHGTEADANAVYGRFNELLKSKGFDNIFVGTVEAEPSLDDCIEHMKKVGATRVTLAPFMVVAGDHAINDMSGDDEDSWKNKFLRAGFEVDLHLAGLGEMESIQAIYARHALDQ